MDIELLSEIHNEMTNIGGIIEISDDKASSITNKIAKNYINDRSLVWWWEGLSVSPFEINYGDEYSWLIIKKIVPNMNQSVYLFVTDDEPEPWPVFNGSLKNIGELISELWRFEYFITDENFEWLIFDTHHNTLVISGVIEDLAKKLYK